jgi:formamidopyrimidine-DNA glycosylase
MPELPEVETLRRELQSAIKGKTIKSAQCDWHKMVRPFSISEFQKQIKNKKIVGVNRRSKVLVLDLAGPLSLQSI